MTDMPIVSKDVLLKAQLPEETYEVPGVGLVRIRSLSRNEYVDVIQRDRAGWEIGLLAFGLVDPPLTEAEAGEWREGSVSPPIAGLVQKIAEISGMLPTSLTEAKRSFPEGPAEDV